MAQSFANRLYGIRSRTGGSREKPRFEWTFGMPVETLKHITMPGPAIRRILGELGFALKLNEAEGRPYEREISAALAALEQSLAQHGALTNEACAEAEKLLLPLEREAKKYTIICAAHAHIDMNWMWSWQETVASALATFRTMLALMDEYPDFHFSQSQASVYRLVEEYDTDLMAEIKARIQEGRWEVTASSWVETDKNMPCTESLLRHIALTKQYMASVWGVAPASLNIDFSPDTFGHSAHVPEIDNYGGLRYFYHCRGMTERRVLYRWRSPSGAELLTHCEPYWYNDGINADIALGVTELAELAGGLKTSLIVYGVGDHGGGPTRRDVERIYEMRDWPVFPHVRFGTFTDYFRAAETVRDKLPVLNGEINFFATGCYTTQSRIKLGNRHSEVALIDAEGLDAMAFLLVGKHYPAQRLEEAWRGVLFTHFHDIITGSCVRDSRDHAMGLFSEALAVAGSAREKAALAIAAHIDTSLIDAEEDEGTQSEGAGAGYGLDHFGGTQNPERGRGKTRVYHVFNPSAYTRRELVEFTVWDWPYDLHRASVTDHEGTALSFQLLDEELKCYWDHQYIRFLAQMELPAFGYATVVFREAEMGKDYPHYFNPFPRSEPAHIPVVLENEYLKADFDPQSGELRSLIDKKTGAEKLAHGATAGLVLSRAEKASNDAWHVGRYLGTEHVTRVTRLRPFTGNTLRNGFELEEKLLDSTIKAEITLDAGARALSYRYNIAWNEASRDHDNAPVLRFALPLADKVDAWQSDVPAGAFNRQGGFQDMPALQYTAALTGSSAVALITDCKYGYRGCEGELSATLINTAEYPDPFPERGEHAIRLWIALSDSTAPKSLIETAQALCHRVNIVSGKPGKNGRLPPISELIELDADSTVLLSVGLAANGALLLRCCETAGQRDTVTLALPMAFRKARLVALDGTERDGAVTLRGNTASFEIAPNTIQGVLLRA